MINARALFARILLLLSLAALVLSTPAGRALPVTAAPESQPPDWLSTLSAGAPPDPIDCAATQPVADLVSMTSQAAWADWIEKLSGEEQVTVGSQPVTLHTRYTYSLFDGSSKAYQYLVEQVSQWYEPGQISEHAYSIGSTGGLKNLVVTITGSQRPDEIVILSAHYDSTVRSSIGDPSLSAPGADDNATGSAALLEAARIMSGKTLPRTLRLVWFTGEEQGLRGSAAYAGGLGAENIVGVINLDMYGYDGNNDRCFEIHAGTLAASNRVGRCFEQSVKAYSPSLLYDYITTGAIRASDHASFWNVEIGAVQIGENFQVNTLPGGCVGAEMNPDYHTPDDRISKINLVTGFAITRAALAAAFQMASPGPFYRQYLPVSSQAQ